ncbi:hypothetical protein H5410_015643 [Solanum commersonii]|uniref:Uncharacterized protein n=1 Tax=Solanum commersonii TaxID=4109 RepID=A0A9J5ZUQ2_SOLCO|nr:hypothetical protein H5410_015643 [Solanum commersonii]
MNQILLETDGKGLGDDDIIKDEERLLKAGEQNSTTIVGEWEVEQAEPLQIQQAIMNKGRETSILVQQNVIKLAASSLKAPDKKKQSAAVTDRDSDRMVEYYSTTTRQASSYWGRFSGP